MKERHRSCLRRCGSQWGSAAEVCITSLTITGVEGEKYVAVLVVCVFLYHLITTGSCSIHVLCVMSIPDNELCQHDNTGEKFDCNVYL